MIKCFVKILEIFLAFIGKLSWQRCYRFDILRPIMISYSHLDLHQKPVLFILPVHHTYNCHFACREDDRGLLSAVCVCVCVRGRGDAAAPAATLPHAECSPLLRVCKSRGATRPCNTRWPAPSPGLDTGNAASLPRSSSAAPPEGGFLPPAEPHVSLGLRSNMDGRLVLFSFFLLSLPTKVTRGESSSAAAAAAVGTFLTQHDNSRPLPRLPTVAQGWAELAAHCCNIKGNIYEFGSEARSLLY